jgi:hypothetical protein
MLCIENSYTSIRETINVHRYLHQKSQSTEELSKKPATTENHSNYKNQLEHGLKKLSEMLRM